MIFCQEILGYNVHMNFDAPGSGQVAAYYGVAGCRSPDDSNDRACMQGVAWCNKNRSSGIEQQPVIFHEVSASLRGTFGG